MCLSAVYLTSNGDVEKVMQDVARMEAKDDGFILENLFGENKFIRGQLKKVDFVEENSVILEDNS